MTDEQLRERDNRLLLALVPKASDEQRKQFETWANKQVLWQHFDVDIDWTGVQYDDMELDLAWDAFRAGQQTRDAEVRKLQAENQQLRQALADVNFGDVQPDERDAEVQALREALAEVMEHLETEVILKHGPIQVHLDAVRSFDRDMEPVHRARKLLAGEGGEAE